MAMTMHGGNGDEAEVMVEINTTPLIDVMLVLLIMLILTIPIQTHAVKLDMPTDAPAQPQQAPPTIVQIDVAPDGSLAWNGEPVASRAQLETRLEAVSADPAPTELHLRPDRAAPYRAVAMVMASAQRLGVKRIGLVGNEQFMP
ncbi:MULTISPECIES: ExbD/TolR family protein [Ralstonia]|uniref:Biopolymer transporter ExbD n=1 Tax=Ralstonia mojiangensis TaxID=2953895 RepID=A0ABT2L678_9RALS|nr:biopolymer transporter ExbD [Ralstonia mojiangensis]MCO5413327.1 biopolymer transporter ExbD [Ralstonia mojiangensis]MCT7297607.1 biopolymer transporter ExbD [Ralstonia mojiangensis]MCT7310209.1 biopolymer transporter ExbD [Ralstonia mojiangensis]